MTKRRSITPAQMRDMPPPNILVALCPVCQHGNDCPGYEKRDAAAGGITCGRYQPRSDPKAALSVAHLMALPDREPCADCACRKGTIPNGTPHSMADFTACVDRREPFLCHADGANRICAGWLRAAKARHG